MAGIGGGKCAGCPQALGTEEPGNMVHRDVLEAESGSPGLRTGSRALTGVRANLRSTLRSWLLKSSKVGKEDDRSSS